MALSTGGRIEKVDYDAIRTNATTSITTVGTTWTWTNTVNVGTLVTFGQVNEVRSAIDKAYDLINRGCTTNNATVNTSYNACPSNYTSNYSGDYTSNYSDYSGNCNDYSDDSSVLGTYYTTQCFESFCNDW